MVQARKGLLLVPAYGMGRVMALTKVPETPGLWRK